MVLGDVSDGEPPTLAKFGGLEVKNATVVRTIDATAHTANLEVKLSAYPQFRWEASYDTGSTASGIPFHINPR